MESIKAAVIWCRDDDIIIALPPPYIAHPS
jgi:hypothetical protein